MKTIIYILLALSFFSCNTTKSVVNKKSNNDSLKVEVQLDTIPMIIDTDGDGVYDDKDECLDRPGSIENNGCPEVSAIEVESYIKKAEDIKYKENNIELIKQKAKNKSIKVIDKTRIIDDQSLGLVAHSVPNEMKVGKIYTVKLRISKDNNKIQLINGNGVSISENEVDSKVTIASIRVEPVMSAKLLSDSSKMLIQSTSTLIQNIDKDGFTEWQWRVTPIKGGDILLKIVVNVIVESDNGSISKDIPVYDEVVVVKSNYIFTFKKFINEYWQWLMTTIIIPLIIWFYNRKKKKKK